MAEYIENATQYYFNNQCSCIAAAAPTTF